MIFISMKILHFFNKNFQQKFSLKLLISNSVSVSSIFIKNLIRFSLKIWFSLKLCLSELNSARFSLKIFNFSLKIFPFSMKIFCFSGKICLKIAFSNKFSTKIELYWAHVDRPLHLSQMKKMANFPILGQFFIQKSK